MTASVVREPTSHDGEELVVGGSYIWWSMAGEPTLFMMNDGEFNWFGGFKPAKIRVNQTSQLWEEQTVKPPTPKPCTLVAMGNGHNWS